MTYELAKKLKDAGFPQGGEGKWHRQNYITTGDEPDYYIPTLSELIDACGEKIGTFRLFLDFKRKAFGVQKEMQGLESVKWFNTPEEAVANLWIELNKK